MTVDCCTGSEHFVNENCIRMMTTAAVAAMAAREEFLCEFFSQDPNRAAAAIPTNLDKRRNDIALKQNCTVHNPDK